MEKAENIAVGVSGGNKSKFLGMLPCASGTARHVADKLFEIVGE